MSDELDAALGRARTPELPVLCPYCKRESWCRRWTRTHAALGELPDPTCGCAACVEHRASGCPPADAPPDPGVAADQEAIRREDAARRAFRQAHGHWPDW